MWVFWGFLGLVVAVVLVVLLYAALTVERSPSHGTRPLTAVDKLRRLIKRRPRPPLSRRQQARKDARRGEWKARVSRLRGLLSRPEQSQKPPPARLVEDAPVEPEPPAEPGAAATEQLDLTESPTDEEWAATLRKQVEAEAAPGPNDHLARPWPETTGTWSAEMVRKMTEDGQMPPADPGAEPGTPADAFMGGANSA